VALNRKIVAVAFDRQSAGKGTLAVTKKYGLALRSGRALDVKAPQQYEELTVANVLPPGAFRQEAGPHGLDIVTRPWPRSLGLLLKLVMGTGSDAVTGASDPFTHTITNQNAMDYMSLFVQYDTEYHSIRDARIDTLGLTWDAAGTLEMNLAAWGSVWTGYGGSFTATTDDSDQTAFFAAGGTFQMDTSSSTPATAEISGGSIVVNRHLSPIRLSKSIEVDEMWPGWLEIVWTLRVIPPDSTLWRKMITGSSSGTAVQASPVFGSAHELFVIASGAPQRDLDITSTRISWNADFPDADPAGGPAEFTFTGTVVKPAAGAGLTYILRNSENAAAYAGS
jgi:hypothetical protein